MDARDTLRATPEASVGTDSDCPRRAVAIVVLALALATGAAGCGGADADRGKPSRDERAASGGERAAPAAYVVGGEGAPPARDRDLGLRVVARSPVGPIAPQHADEYEIRVEVRNRADHPVSASPAALHVSVFRDALLVPGCGEGEPQEIELEPVIAPGTASVARARLPCALVTPGTYEIAVVLLTPGEAARARAEVLGGDDDDVGATLAYDARRAASATLVIDGSLPPFSVDAVPSADILPEPAEAIPEVRPLPVPAPLPRSIETDPDTGAGLEESFTVP